MTPHAEVGRPMSFDDLKARQLAILDRVAEHCERHGLRWYLYAGTLLGAVRHHGYIPWDDDIDLWLPRADYEEFCRTFGRDCGDGSLSVHSLTTSPHYALPFAKVCDDRTRLAVESEVVEDIGVFVDLFPLDGWHDSPLLRVAQRRTLHLLLNAVRAKSLVIGERRNRRRNAVLRLAKAVTSPVSARTLGRWITAVARTGSYDACKRVGVLAWGTLEVFPAAAFSAATPTLFEGRELPAPSGTDEVLRIQYGAYWELPPEDQRVTHHRFTAYELP